MIEVLSGISYLNASWPTVANRLGKNFHSKLIIILGLNWVKGHRESRYKIYFNSLAYQVVEFEGGISQL